MRSRWKTAAALALMVTSQSQAATFTVGPSGTGCTHTNLQAAVDSAAISAGADTIRIARNATYTAQQITINSSEELYLIGGFATCAATTSNSPNTELSGAGGNQAPVLDIRSSSVVYLQNLRITGGDNTPTGGFGLGGGIFFTGSGALEIVNSSIDQNSANFGGGIYAVGSATTSEVFVRDDVVIGFNTARVSGGGVVAAGLEFTVQGVNTTILSNQALGIGGGGFGGGALVLSTASFPSFLYLGADGIGGVGGVHGNSAVFGGGIAAIGTTDSGRSAEVQVYSTIAGRPAQISANSASSQGGAFYLLSDNDFDGDATAIARLQFANVIDNSAPDGAAFFGDTDAAGGASPIVSAVVQYNVEPLIARGVPCSFGLPCGVMSNNIASAPGGAIVQQGNAAIDFNFSARRLQVQNNQAGYLWLLRASNTVLYNSLLSDNVVRQELIRQIGTDFDSVGLYNLTVANNQIAAMHVFRIQDNFTLYNSVIAQPGNTITAPGTANFEGGSNVSDNVGNLPSGVSVLTAPRFIDPARRDYRPRAGSRAIDRTIFIDLPGPNYQFEDLLGRGHDVDIPGIGSLNRHVDAGAFERESYLPLVLNPTFDSDLNLWQATQTAESSWDGTQNIAGPAGSGSARVVFEPAPGRAPLVAGRGQCIHIPVSGMYQLNAFGRVLPASTIMATRRARLVWELRFNDGNFGCDSGPPDQTGVLDLSSTGTWTQPLPAMININANFNTSLTIKLDVLGSAVGQTTGWFDGITLMPAQPDTIFANGFE